MRNMIIIFKGSNYWAHSVKTAVFVREFEKKFANPNEKKTLRSEKGNEKQHNANEKEGK